MIEVAKSERYYAPVFETAGFFREVRALRFDRARAYIPKHHNFDRVSLDRALLIWVDICRRFPEQSLSITDLGGNAGFISIMLCCLGMSAICVDHNLPHISQHGYPADLEKLGISQAMLAGCQDSFRFVNSTIDDYVLRDNSSDLTLLLSVVHQWWTGYAGSDVGSKTESEILSLVQRIFARSKFGVYFEYPDSRDGFSARDVPDLWLSFPDLLKTRGIAREVTPIGKSPDARGAMRTIYYCR